MSNWICARSVALLSLLSGCTTTHPMHLQTERALAAVGFVQHRGTPDVAARLKEYPPYTFLKIQEKKQKVRYAYSSPARRTIFVGDEEALKHYSSYLVVLQQSENIRRIQKQQQWAQTQQALAYGLIAGAAAMSQQQVYQPTVYAAPPTGNVGASPASVGNRVYPTLQGTSLRDYSQIAPAGVVREGKVYATLPGTSLRDYSQVGPVGIVQENKVYPTLEGTSLRDYSQMGPVGVVE